MAKKKSDGENKDLLELGKKQRAGQLISGYIRAIGCEVTEVIVEDTPDGCPQGMPKLVSKAEALARYIWSHALPKKDDDGNYKAPDKDFIRLVLDRIEGKPGIVGAEQGDNKESVPDRISRLSAERLNRMAEESGE